MHKKKKFDIVFVLYEGNIHIVIKKQPRRFIMAITKEYVLKALNEGRVTCNFKGGASSIDPQKAREFLLKNLDRTFDSRYEVDLSFEQKYAKQLD